MPKVNRFAIETSGFAIECDYALNYLWQRRRGKCVRVKLLLLIDFRPLPTEKVTSSHHGDRYVRVRPKCFSSHKALASFVEIGLFFQKISSFDSPSSNSTCKGRSNWIFHRKLNYYICCLRDAVLKQREISQTACKILQCQG